MTRRTRAFEGHPRSRSRWEESIERPSNDDRSRFAFSSACVLDWKSPNASTAREFDRRNALEARSYTIGHVVGRSLGRSVNAHIRSVGQRRAHSVGRSLREVGQRRPYSVGRPRLLAVARRRDRVDAEVFIERVRSNARQTTSHVAREGEKAFVRFIGRHVFTHST